MLIQPIIRILSDRTRNPKFARRNPYFFIGAIMCSLSLFAFQKIKDAEILLVFFDKVPEEKNYNKVSIDEEAEATLDAGLLLQKNKKYTCYF